MRQDIDVITDLFVWCVAHALETLGDTVEQY